jgi:hypothetical protein
VEELDLERFGGGGGHAATLPAAPDVLGAASRKHRAIQPGGATEVAACGSGSRVAATSQADLRPSRR